MYPAADAMLVDSAPFHAMHGSQSFMNPSNVHLSGRRVSSPTMTTTHRSFGISKIKKTSGLDGYPQGSSRPRVPPDTRNPPTTNLNRHSPPARGVLNDGRVSKPAPPVSPSIKTDRGAINIPPNSVLGPPTAENTYHLRSIHNFINAVKSQVHPQAHNHFIFLLQEHNAQRITPFELIELIVPLFQHQPSLLEGCRVFLPSGWRMTLSSGFVFIASPIGETMNVSMAVFDNPELPVHPAHSVPDPHSKKRKR